jgi:ATP-dependent DNA helicase PIF1
MTDNIIITDEFAAALDLMENTRENVFITGKAGTGKSTLLKLFRARTKKNVAVCAPTGIAALNVGAQTIHSLFCLPARHLDVEDPPEIMTRNAVAHMDVLVIDEISMVRADMFQMIDYHLRHSRQKHLPFGGVQIIVIGDLFQLPPVVTREASEHFAQYHASPFFFSTRAYEAGNFHFVELSQVHRQADPTFVNILNQVREGQMTAESLRLLNTRVNENQRIEPGMMVLTTTNSIADKINSDQMRNLSTPPKVFKGWVEGKFKPGAQLPAPDVLILKEGAQVMFLRNDPMGAYVNGSLGVIEKISDTDGVKVKVNDKSVSVYRAEWETIGYEYDAYKRKIVEQTLGTYRQLPIQPAWACTIHKSQGRTLDRAFINLGKGAFAPGQLYVALSRLKTFEGVILRRPVGFSDILVDEEVTEFVKKNR